MAKLKIDYSEARDWYIKGDKDKEDARKDVDDGGLDMCFDFDLSYAIINSVNSTDSEDILNQILNSYASYPHNQWGTFISNHDQNRAILSLSNNPEKLKKYGMGWCGDEVGFVGHWDGSELIKTETKLFPFLKELEKNWPMIYKNFSILDGSQNKIIDGWKDGWE